MSATRLPCLALALVLLVAVTPSSGDLDARTAELVTCTEAAVTGRRMVSVRCSPVHDAQSSSVFVAPAPAPGASALDSIRCEKRARRAGGMIIGCRHQQGWFRFVADAQGSVVETSSSSSTYTSSVSAGHVDAVQPLMPAGGDVFGDSALPSNQDSSPMARGYDGGYYQVKLDKDKNRGNRDPNRHIPATYAGGFHR